MSYIIIHSKDEFVRLESDPKDVDAKPEAPKGMKQPQDVILW